MEIFSVKNKDSMKHEELPQNIVCQGHGKHATPIYIQFIHGEFLSMSRFTIP
jgi:hypothetical protein